MKEFIVHSEAELSEVADFLLSLLHDRPVVTLTGELGAGKTALVKSICRLLGVIDDVSSPTFAFVNTYLTDSGRPVYHIDLYRLVTVEELVQIGIDDYLYSGEITFIEWPALISVNLPDNTLEIRLEHIDKQTRKIVIL